MIVIVFRSRLTESAQNGQFRQEYLSWAERMIALAKTCEGFVSFQSFTAEDGERLSISEFENEEAVRAWKAHPEHREAQRRGREIFYEEYRVQVSTEDRSYSFRKRG